MQCAPLPLLKFLKRPFSCTRTATKMASPAKRGRPPRSEALIKIALRRSTYQMWNLTKKTKDFQSGLSRKELNFSPIFIAPPPPLQFWSIFKNFYLTDQLSLFSRKRRLENRLWLTTLFSCPKWLFKLIKSEAFFWDTLYTPTRTPMQSKYEYSSLSSYFSEQFCTTKCVGWLLHVVVFLCFALVYRPLPKSTERSNSRRESGYEILVASTT